jgi:hypothetical protein
MPHDLTPAEHTMLAETSQLEGTVCALISLALTLVGLGWSLTGRWEGAAALGAAVLLIAAANRAFAAGDRHRSAAAQEDQP